MQCLIEGDYVDEVVIVKGYWIGKDSADEAMVVRHCLSRMDCLTE